MIPGILRKTSALLAGFALLAAPALSQNTTPAPAETHRLHVELTLEEAIRAAQEQKKIVWSEIKWVDKVFYNNEVENVKFLKSGRLAFENREDV